MNVPLKEGMTDEAYEKLFKPVMRKVMEIYQPEAIVFQSGQQSLIQLVHVATEVNAHSQFAFCRSSMCQTPHTSVCMCRSGLIGW